jgi:hypothetical protein
LPHLPHLIEIIKKRKETPKVGVLCELGVKEEKLLLLS